MINTQSNFWFQLFFILELVNVDRENRLIAYCLIKDNFKNYRYVNGPILKIWETFIMKKKKSVTCFKHRNICRWGTRQYFSTTLKPINILPLSICYSEFGQTKMYDSHKLSLVNPLLRELPTLWYRWDLHLVYNFNMPHVDFDDKSFWVDYVVIQGWNHGTELENTSQLIHNSVFFSSSFFLSYLPFHISQLLWLPKVRC